MSSSIDFAGLLDSAEIASGMPYPTADKTFAALLLAAPLKGTRT